MRYKISCVTKWRYNIRIYICHTYGRRHGLNMGECEKNTEDAIHAGRRLIKRGHNAFIPNLWHFVNAVWSTELPEERYFSLVSEWLRFCDAVYVAKMPQWEGSGVQREIDMAKALGIPVYYDIEEIPIESEVM